MKRTTAPVVVAIAIVLTLGVVGATLAFGTGSVDAHEENRTADEAVERTITVTGTGDAEAEPDQAEVFVAVVAEGDDPAAVRNDLRDGADALRDGLAAANVTDDQIETTEYQISERYRDFDEDPDSDEPAYRGIHAFTVTLDDVNQTGEVTDASADAGAQIQRVAFTLSEDRRIELRDEALTNAMDDARRQATTLAEAGDLQVTGVRTIDATDRQHGPVIFEDAVAEADEGGGTTFEPGDVTVTVRVSVTYDAESTADAESTDDGS